MKRKENKAMRLASVLLVLTLLSTSMIAGTFAKYVTEETKTATARVAKFGVDIKVDADELFGEKYNAQNKVETGNGDVTVKADQMVVAPGTSGSMTFSVAGTPETAVKLAVSINQTSQVKLAAGTYQYADDAAATIADGVDTDGQVVIEAEGYTPIKWTLKGANDTEITGCTNTTLAKINDYLTGATFTKDFAANTNLKDTIDYTLSWEWPYDDTTTPGKNDGADTILGNLQANVGATSDIIKITKDDQGTALTEGTDYNLTESFTFTIKVEQAD